MRPGHKKAPSGSRDNGIVVIAPLDLGVGVVFFFAATFSKTEVRYVSNLR